MLSSSGISCRHGPHHVAQKLIMTTWPLYWARLMVLPPRAFSWNCGAGPACLMPADEIEATDRAAAAIRAARMATRVNPDFMCFPLKENGQSDVGFEVVGELALAEEVRIEHAI